MYAPAAHRTQTPLRHAGRLLSALLLIGLSGCISTSLIEHWKDPGFSGPAMHKVLVVGVQRDAGRRRVWESGMVEALMRQHIAATPSYQYFPDRAPSAEQLAATARREGFDGVLATHFVGASRGAYWMPGYAGVGFGWRWRYFGYWGAEYGPGYVESDYRADFQTDVFTIAPDGGRLVWTGLTRSVDLSSVGATTDQISRVLVPDLIREGILAPG
jgi:hypothetical protein